MSSEDRNRAIGRALRQYLGARDEDVPAAWGQLESLLTVPRDSLLIADAARGAHKALEQEVRTRRELVEALETGPNSLLPVLGCIDDMHYVVSIGNGVYQRVGLMPPEDGEPRLLRPEEFEARGPALVALDSSGSIIVDVYWPNENEELFHLVLGGDEGLVLGVDDGADGAGADAEAIPLALEACES